MIRKIIFMTTMMMVVVSKIKLNLLRMQCLKIILMLLSLRLKRWILSCRSLYRLNQPLILQKKLKLHMFMNMEVPIQLSKKPI